jgi:CheY-like chemotaxis protein
MPEHQSVMKLMIVDDNQDVLTSLRMLFEAEGYEVTTVDNGWKCLQQCEQGFKGIIILDIMMPVMDGIETIKNMVVEGYIDDNVIVVLTAKKVQGAEFDEIYPYIHDYINKPFDVNALLKIIKDIQQKHS